MVDREEAKNVVIIGDGYVGKTSILHAIKQLDFEEQIPNVYEEFEIEARISSSVTIKIKLMDTAGQEEYGMLRQLYYKKAALFLLCFSLEDQVSFENLVTKWLPDLENYRKTVPIILVGTKLDLRSGSNQNNCISKEQGLRFQKTIGALSYVECSSKNNKGIADLKNSTVKTLTNYASNQRKCVVQ